MDVELYQMYLLKWEDFPPLFTSKWWIMMIFKILHYSCTAGKKSNLIMMWEPTVLYCWIHLLIYSFKFLASMFTNETGPSCFLSCNVLVLSVFGYQGYAGLTKWVRECFLSFCSLGEFVWYWYLFFLQCLVEFTVEATRPWSFFVERILIMILISLIIIGLFRSSLSRSFQRTNFLLCWSSLVWHLFSTSLILLILFYFFLCFPRF